MQHIKPKKKNKRSKHIVEKISGNGGSTRTRYERIYESYCKLLGQPYIIDSIFCFFCNNFYYYGDIAALPKRCRVCLNDFHLPISEKKGCAARPDFIIDFNNPEARQQYNHDTHHRMMQNISLYREEYMKKVGIVRIDGTVHNTHTQAVKDYWQVENFKNAGVKVFIVTNDDIDRMLQNNGKELLEHAHMIGDCIIHEDDYIKYCQNKDYLERTKRPF